MDQHIVQLTDESNPIRLSHRQRIERVYTNLVNKIEAMKATDPASFRVRDPSTDVNTNPDGSDADPPGTHTGSTGSTP